LQFSSNTIPIQYQSSSIAIQYHTNTYAILNIFNHCLTFYLAGSVVTLLRSNLDPGNDHFVSLVCFAIKLQIKNSPYYNFLSHHIRNVHMSSANALRCTICLVLLQYCSFSTQVLQYQYQSFSILLQYKTARLVHPCQAVLFPDRQSPD
jgi:hypothetical protein